MYKFETQSTKISITSVEIATKAMDKDTLWFFWSILKQNIFYNYWCYDKMVTNFSSICNDGTNCYYEIVWVISTVWNSENYHKWWRKMLTGASFHPSLNGCSETGVKIILQFFKKCSTSLNHLNTFLLMYRNTPHSSTNKSPVKLMLGYSTWTLFDLLILITNKVVFNNQITQIKNRGKRAIDLQEGDGVLTKRLPKTRCKLAKGQNYRKHKSKYSLSTIR